MLKIINEKKIWVFLFQKYDKFWIVSLDNCIKQKPHILEEWGHCRVVWKVSCEFYFLLWFFILTHICEFPCGTPCMNIHNNLWFLHLVTKFSSNMLIYIFLNVKHALAIFLMTKQYTFRESLFRFTNGSPFRNKRFMLDESV